MLSVSDVRAKVKRRLCGSSGTMWSPDHKDFWPYAIGLAVPSGKKLPCNGGALLDWADSILRFGTDYGAVVDWGGRNLGYSGGRLPVRVIIPDEDAAARISGCVEDLEARNERLHILMDHGVNRDIAFEALRGIRDKPDTLFHMLLDTAMWARTHRTQGMTPRQLPIPGVQGKTLNDRTSRNFVELISGIPNLGLVERPYLVKLKYLDRRASIRFGMADPYPDSPGADAKPDYPVDCVIVVENRDTFVNFPLLDRSVCVLGDGRACISYLPGIEWIQHTGNIFYWGDMDLDGLMILDSLREHGVPARSILMDVSAYSAYSFLGTTLDRRNKPLRTNQYPSTLSNLTESELELYRHIRSGVGPVLRIEQEKIPYSDALACLHL